MMQRVEQLPEATRARGFDGLTILWPVALAAALTLAWMPIDQSIGRFIYDDMFYYLKVAEHIVAGNGSTFDGTEPTNGYHPIWLMICTGLAFFFSGKMLVHAVLTVAAILHVVQGVLLARILSRFARDWVVLALTALYLLNWRTLAVNLCGLEIALAGAAALFVLDRLLAEPAPFDRWRYFRTGLLLGFAALCRFDLLLLCAFGVAWIVCDWRYRGRVWLEERFELAAFTVAGIVVMLVPWFVFSWSVSEVLLPNSRHAVKFLSSVHYDLSNPAQMLDMAINQFWSALWWSADIANFYGVFPVVGPEGKAFFGSGLALAALVSFVLIGALLMRKDDGVRLASVVLVYCAMHAGYYLVFHRVELRYVLPVLVFFFVPLAAVLEGILRRASTGFAGKAVAASLLVAFGGVTWAGLDAYDRGYGSVRVHKYHYVAMDMAEWLAREHPGAKVGAWNAGIMSYFSNTELVNLDGVMNDGALEAIRAGRIGDYIQEREIRFLVDEPNQIESNLDAFDRSGTTRDWLGPVVHTATDEEGRIIVAREVLRSG